MSRGLDGYFFLLGYPAMPLHWRCVVLKAREERSLPISGGYSEGETPLPFPNRAVKPLCADGTWLARAWESRSPPVLLHSRPRHPGGGVVCVSGVRGRGPAGVAPRGVAAVARACPGWGVDGAFARFAGTRARLRRLPGCPPFGGALGQGRAVAAARRRGLGEATGRRRELPAACSSRQLVAAPGVLLGRVDAVSTGGGDGRS